MIRMQALFLSEDRAHFQMQYEERLIVFRMEV